MAEAWGSRQVRTDSFVRGPVLGCRSITGDQKCPPCVESSVRERQTVLRSRKGVDILPGLNEAENSSSDAKVRDIPLSHPQPRPLLPKELWHSSSNNMYQQALRWPHLMAWTPLRTSSWRNCGAWTQTRRFRGLGLFSVRVSNQAKKKKKNETNKL